MSIRPLLLTCMLLSIVTPAQLSAQYNPLIDSLIQALPQQEDSLKVELLVKIAHHLHDIDLATAMIYAQQGSKLATDIHYPLGLAKSYHQIALCHFLAENLKEGKRFIEKAKQLYLSENAERYLSGIYAQLAHLLTNKGDYETSLAYLKKGLAISKKYKDDQISGTIIFSIAHIYSILGNYSKAFELMEESLPLIQHKPYLINYYAILGELYFDSGDVEKGLEVLFKSVAVCEELDNQLSLAYIYESIGRAYSEIGSYEQSADYYFKIIAINEQRKIPFLDILYHSGLGNLYRLWNNYEAALQQYQKGWTIATDNELLAQMTKIQTGMGLVELDQNNLPIARTHFEKALVLAKKTKSLEAIIDNYLQLSETYILSEQYHQAHLILTEAKTFISKKEHIRFYSSLMCKLGYVQLKKGAHQQSVSILLDGLKHYEKGKKNKLELRDYTQYLSEAYEALDEDQLALQYYKQYVQLQDSISQTLNSKAILKTRIAYETVQKEKQIELLQKNEENQSLVLLNQKSDLLRQKLYILILGLIILLGGGIGWILFNRFKWKKRMEQVELEKKHLKISQRLELAELRTQLFANVSHEFRTPLTLIMGPLESALKKNNKGHVPYQMMYRNAQKLLELVNQTLDLTKLESGHSSLQKQTSDINQFLREIAVHFLPLAELKNITFTIDLENQKRLLLIDPSNLEKAVSNILRNAFEHSFPGGQITIHSQLQNSNEFIIKVKDTGKGIPMMHQKLIFDRYYQVDQNNNKGTGIGLALAKEIIELHDGTIEVESEETQGALFKITLPYDMAIENKPSYDSIPKTPEKDKIFPAKAASTLAKQAPQHQVTKPTILVIEDHPEVNNYLIELFSKTANTISAFNGKEALSVISQFNPDLIICDIMMPEMDGYEFTQILKNDIKTSHIPIILLTAKATHENKLDGLKIGADDYLTKPFHVEELLLRSHNIIEQRKRLKHLFNVQQVPIPVHQLTNNQLDEAFLNKAIQIVNQNIADAGFNVEKFTLVIGMSRTTLYTKLKALTNKSILEFIRALRIQRAVELIKSNRGNMNEVAYTVGFNNRQSFIHAFKTEMQQTPTDFKKSLVGTDMY